MYSKNMPTIIELRGYRIVINTRDHLPPHVHCVGPGVEAKIEIQTRKVMENNGVGSRDLALLKKLIASREEELMNEWRRIHGEE